MGWTCGMRVEKVKVNTNPSAWKPRLGKYRGRMELLNFNSGEGCKVLTGLNYQLSEG